MEQTLPIELTEAFSISAEIIRQLVEGKNSQEILENIDFSDDFLVKISKAMEAVAKNPQSMIVVLNDGETISNYEGCSIRYLNNDDEDIDDEDNLGNLLIAFGDYGPDWETTE